MIETSQSNHRRSYVDQLPSFPIQLPEFGTTNGLGRPVPSVILTAAREL
jgi:hypothetical protein